MLNFPVAIFILLIASLMAQSDQNVTKRNFTQEEESEIELIGWKWDWVGRYFVVVVFFLMGAFAKIVYHNTRWLRTQIPESCVLIILGSVVGFLVHVTDIRSTIDIPQFTPEKFFAFYLPPIILESAYALHDRTFFHNIGTILLFAVAGTLINIFAIGWSLHICSKLGLYSPFSFTLIECFTFATLISAVDPVAVIAIFQEVNVDKALYFLVFGESLFNDAVVITLYNTITTIAASPKLKMYHIFMSIASFMTISGGGIVVGIFYGTFTSLITRMTKNVRVIEPMVVILCAYISYFTAELFHFSGIICLICCGLVQAAYTRHNISDKSYTTIKYLVKTLSSISDVVIFLFLGMVLIRDLHVWNTYFILTLQIFCLIYRFLGVFVLTWVANHWFKRMRLITCQEQFIMAYGGLRGAIAFALAIVMNPEHVPSVDLFITATLVTILFTVFVQGSTTKPIVRLLGLQMDSSDKGRLFFEINLKIIETAMNGFEDIIGQPTFITTIRRTLDNINEKIIKKALIKDRTYRWSVVRAAISQINRNQEKKVFTLLNSFPAKEHSANHPLPNRRYSESVSTMKMNGNLPNRSRLLSDARSKHNLTAARRVSDVSIPMRTRFSTDSNIEDFREALNEALGKMSYYRLPRTRSLHMNSRRISNAL